jgi:hypothetical protein
MAGMVALALMVTSCASPRAAVPVTTSNNVALLTSLPDADAARQSAPVFTRAALTVINGLELEIKELKAERGK